jgi:hypothetical protein
MVRIVESLNYDSPLPVSRPPLTHEWSAGKRLALSPPRKPLGLLVYSSVGGSPGWFAKGDVVDRRAINRRMFLTRGLAVLGAVAFPSACGGKSTLITPTATTTTGSGQGLAVYRLHVADAKCTADQLRGGHCSCRACAAHAANKLFPTSEAADANRAHQHCNCLVDVAGNLPQGTWIELFGEPTKLTRQSVDRRAPGIREKVAGLL